MKCAVAIPYFTHDKPQAQILFLVKLLDSSAIVFNMRVLCYLTTYNKNQTPTINRQANTEDTAFTEHKQVILHCGQAGGAQSV
jgi:hypothetical protein